ncbi:metallophosphoesterase [Candidatus Uabimicrobium sp. HlEnr_7]|uniref:metallophosphoesterase family protein n=1 Tax=Candidatus Uabimicrobium helgolandensis TaxID=3095367 RepID=UPI0035591B9D
MRYGIYSDIHGNYEALEAVLEVFLHEGVDKYICGGDVVGYGANPKECLEKVLELDSMLVAGNHDYAIAGKLKIDYFNQHARQAVMWTREQLSKKYKNFLASVDMVQRLDDKLTLVHSTLSFPELFDYIQTGYDAHLSLEILDTPICFYGHSHVPVAFFEGHAVTFSMDDEIDVNPDSKVLVNVGSVGQPRDGNPLASCCVYDDELGKVWIHRVEYDIDTAVEKIMRAGLPEILAKRLYYGK